MAASPFFCYVGQGFSDPKPVDNACLLSLLEGVCQRCLEKYAEAEECDLFVINRYHWLHKATSPQ